MPKMLLRFLLAGLTSATVGVVSSTGADGSTGAIGATGSTAVSATGSVAATSSGSLARYRVECILMSQSFRVI